MNLFEKHMRSLTWKYCSVVKDGTSGCTSEYPVLIAFQDFHIQFCGSVDHGDEFHLESAVAADFPWSEIGCPAECGRRDVIQFVADSVVEDDIFSCGVGVTESVAQIKPERLPQTIPFSDPQYQMLS